MNLVDPQSIFQLHNPADFSTKALEVFRFQAAQCEVYRNYLALINVDPQRVVTLGQIPFLPIKLFKSHSVYSGLRPVEKVFTSSSTSGQTPARHQVADLSLYRESFVRSFEYFYGRSSQTAIFALLPSYLEREGSSLIYMVKELIERGGGGFYLHDHATLLRDLAAHSGRKILLGVSYALWELAESHPTRLRNTIIMETGGMKGHREELPRETFHHLLCKAFEVGRIHSEYGMAELLSQGYSNGGGLFRTPPWMQIRIRDLNDPFAFLPAGQSGGVNVIDLANLYSCSFLQTQDLGTLYVDRTFRILGRITGSEVRGCNLLIQ